MAWLIQSLEILNLPEYGDDTNWEVWDKIDLQWWKNLMLVWLNWSGKSTMLSVLRESVERAGEVLIHESKSWFRRPDFQEKNIFLEFSFQAWSFLSIDWWDETLRLWHEEQDAERIQQEYIDETFEKVLWEAYGWGLINIFNEGLQSTYGQAERVLRDYKSNAESRWWFWSKPDKADPNDLLDAAKRYSVKKWIPEEVVYGNIIALCNNVHDMMRYDNISYWWVKPTWDEDAILNAQKVVLDNSDPNWESLWERSKRIIQELMKVKTATIAILDEPTNGVDMMSHGDHVNSIMNMSDKVQMIAATHDPQLFKAVSKSGDWIVHNLWEKKAA